MARSDAYQFPCCHVSNKQIRNRDGRGRYAGQETDGRSRKALVEAGAPGCYWQELLQQAADLVPLPQTFTCTILISQSRFWMS